MDAFNAARSGNQHGDNMSKSLSCTSCKKDIDEGALELGSAEVIEVEPDEYALYCFDCAEAYRANARENN
jgi:hypothetical protein